MSSTRIGNPGTDIKVELSGIFHSIQGEGLNSGVPMVFVRFFGCNLSCPWCDTGYAKEPRPGELEKDISHHKTAYLSDIIAEVKKYPCKNVIITGGEPFYQAKALYQLILTLKSDPEVNIAIETNGTIDSPASCAILPLVDYLSVSPKLGMGVDWSPTMISRANEVRCAVSSLQDIVEYSNMLNHMNSQALRILSPINMEQPAIDAIISWLKAPAGAGWRASFQLFKLIDIGEADWSSNAVSEV